MLFLTHDTACSFVLNSSAQSKKTFLLLSGLQTDTNPTTSRDNINIYQNISYKSIFKISTKLRHLSDCTVWFCFCFTNIACLYLLRKTEILYSNNLNAYLDLEFVKPFLINSVHKLCWKQLIHSSLSTFTSM